MSRLRSSKRADQSTPDRLHFENCRRAWPRSGAWGPRPGSPGTGTPEKPQFSRMTSVKEQPWNRQSSKYSPEKASPSRESFSKTFPTVSFTENPPLPRPPGPGPPSRRPPSAPLREPVPGGGRGGLLRHLVGVLPSCQRSLGQGKNARFSPMASSSWGRYQPNR